MTELVESLLPHQRRLVEEYRLGSAPPAVILDGPPGTGKTRALSVIAAERAGADALVIVVVQPALIGQWTRELSLAGVVPAAVYASPADFRRAFEEPSSPWPSTGVVVCAWSVLQTPLVAKTVTTIAPSLLIADEVAPSAGSQLGRSLRALADRSRQAIVTAGAGPNRWHPEGEKRTWAYPLVDNVGRTFGPSFRYRVREFDSDPVETELVRAALDLLARVAYPSLAAPLTRSAVQAALLGLVRRMEAPEQLPLWEEGQMELDAEQGWSTTADPAISESAWEILDGLDDLASDGRLTAATDEIESALVEDLHVVVICERVREVDYVIAAMHSMHVATEAITGRMRVQERDLAMARFVAGGVMVVTASVFSSMQSPLPHGTRSIWFSPPRTPDQVRQRLTQGIASVSVEIVLLKATPPATPADQLVDQVMATLADPWGEHPRLPVQDA